MNQELQLLSLTAASLGFMHTIMGPDHYLPFVVMSKSAGWSGIKTATITFLCGLGHVLSSVVLGFIGIAIGSAVAGMEAIEAIRGEFAAYALITFGLIYMIWGIWRAGRKNQSHGHLHLGKKKMEYDVIDKKPNLTPWVLFTIFVLGPCEPLIPILMYPAAKSNLMGVFIVAGIFSIVTIATMMTAVLVLRAGLVALPMRPLEKYMHAIAGAAILLCGVSIQFLGL